MDYQVEQNEWDQFIYDHIGQKSRLLCVSVYSSDCRVYTSELGVVFKIRHLTPASIRGRLNTLEDEYLILKHLIMMDSIPKPIRYRRFGSWEVMEMSEITSLPKFDPTFGRSMEKFSDFFTLLKLVLKLNLMGCSHGDLHFNNAGRNIQGGISIFDFDQAVLASPVQCFLRDFLGMGAYARSEDISLFDRAKNVEFISIFVKILRIPKSLYNSLHRNIISVNVDHPSEIFSLKSKVELLDDANLSKLYQSWDIARKSNASSPGKNLAYYSLDVGGINFPGERPWLLRWKNICQSVNFTGKKFLELGCNLGLLSIHARLSGAEKCLGIDIDQDIVYAATLASEAFKVDTEFKRLDLDDLAKWELELDGYDIVSALSIMHWIKDKERVWEFLSRHKEILYEGHEQEYLAIQKLNDAGFVTVISLCTSERGRGVYWAIK